MKNRRVLGICFALLMLVMTACGGYENARPQSMQEYETTVSQSSQEHETTVSLSPQEHETTAPQDSQEHEAATPQDSQESETVTPQSSQEYETAEPENSHLPEYGEYYYDLVNVVLYLDVYDELPPNYITKRKAQDLGWEGGSVEKYKEGAAIGGDTFGNREGLLPEADGRRYTECDIDTNGYSSRGSRRLVFSNDGLYFYTSDHYETFSKVTVTEEYEVIW